MNLLLRFKRAYNTFKKYEKRNCRTFTDSVGCWWILLKKDNPYQRIEFWDRLCVYTPCDLLEKRLWYSSIDDDGVLWVESEHYDPRGEKIWYVF